MSAYAPFHTFLLCKKHVEDDIARKLVDLGLNDETSEILADIFGCEKTRQKGLIDCRSKEEFLAKVLSVTEKWDTLKEKKTPHKIPEFSIYFQKHIKDDMQDGLLLNVRRSTALGDEFFTTMARNVVTSSTSPWLEKGRCRKVPVTALA